MLHNAESEWSFIIVMNMHSGGRQNRIDHLLSYNLIETTPPIDLLISYITNCDKVGISALNLGFMADISWRIEKLTSNNRE